MKKLIRSDAIVLSVALLAAGLAAVPQARAAQENSSGRQSLGAQPVVETVKEVVVTARRRKELMENVPITISAISGQQAKLRGIDNTKDLVMSTPGLQFNQESNFSGTPFLRGVGTLNGAAGTESPVAVYVDGVYIASPNANFFELNDIDSIQVLYGPQGTLFGRNATAGVIQIKTKDPSFEPGGRVSVGYGNYGTFHGSFYGTSALSDNVAVNLAVQGSRQSEGFGHSVTTGREVNKSWNFSARTKLLADLGNSTKVLLEGDYSQMRSDMGSNTNIYPGTIGFGGTKFAGYYNTNTAGIDYGYIVSGGLSLRIDQEMSFANLVSISAYRYTGMKSGVDQDGAPINLVYLTIEKSPTRTFSQELRLVSKADSKLKWVVGTYYIYDNSEYDPAQLSGLAFAPFDYVHFKTVQELNSIAGFASGTYRILPRTDLTLGIRYTKDFYKYNSEGEYLIGGGLPTTFIPGSQYRTKSNFPKLTYRAILDHYFAPHVMGYFSYSVGFNSGGYNLSTPGAQQPVKPEVLDAYEIGVKNRLLDGRLTLDASAYYYKYKNIVVNVIHQTSVLIINAAAAEIKGIDANFTATPFDGFEITGGFNFNDAKYTSFQNGPVFTQNPNPPFGNIESAANLAGKYLTDAPRYTVSLTPSYAFAVGNGVITLTAGYYYNSGYFGDPANSVRQKAYNLVNASVDDQWKHGLDVRLWVKNLSDTRHYLFFSPGTFDTVTSYAPPRMFGITLSKDF